MAHGSAEFEELARSWPPRPTSTSGAAVGFPNLAALWANYSERGADRLLVAMLLEERGELRGLYDAIPGAEVTIARLHAPLALLEERVRRRPGEPEDELTAARWWARQMERSPMGDIVLDNSTRRPDEVAAELLRLVGWLEGTRATPS